MSSEWIQTTIGDQIQLQRGIDITKRDFRDGSIPVVSSGGVGGFHDTPTGTAPGVILGRKGVVGSVYYLPTDYWAHDTTLWVKDFKGNHPRYVYYFFKSIAGTLRDLDVGSANPTLNRNHVHPIETSWASLADQQAIAQILGTLDDKIELNRKTNDTLEAMAKALFKSWFVDFDPVRAKAEGRPAGLPNEISDLFPDSFEESELGRIPVGWRVAPVGEVVECVGGSTPSTSEPDYWDGGEYFWATPKDLSGLSEPFLLDTAKKVTAEGVQRISSGILPAGTVLLSSRAPVGYVACSCVPISINQGFIAIKAGPEMPSSYLLNWCIDNVQQFKDRATGTTFPEISKAAFRPIPLLVPDSPVLKEFDRSVQAVYESVISNMKESALLVKVRDTLLPKLISGELRIPDAEKLLEEAGI